MQPVQTSVDQLRTMMNTQFPSLLLIGKQESVIDPIVAVQNAKLAGFQVKLYDKASHMFCVEAAKDRAIASYTLTVLSSTN